MDHHSRGSLYQIAHQNYAVARLPERTVIIFCFTALVTPLTQLILVVTVHTCLILPLACQKDGYNRFAARMNTAYILCWARRYVSSWGRPEFEPASASRAILMAERRFGPGRDPAASSSQKQPPYFYDPHERNPFARDSNLYRRKSITGWSTFNLNDGDAHRHQRVHYPHRLYVATAVQGGAMNCRSLESRRKFLARTRAGAPGHPVGGYYLFVRFECELTHCPWAKCQLSEIGSLREIGKNNSVC